MNWLMRCACLLGLLYGSLLLHAEVFPVAGKDSAGAAFFRDWYQQGDLVHYLDNYSDYTIYQAETTGKWTQPDRLLFSIQGNSYRWNRFYYDGFRIDSRFTPGSTLYRPNMEYHSLTLDTHQSGLWFTQQTYAQDKAGGAPNNYIALSGNIGGIGGVSPGTKEMINLFHLSALERLGYDVYEVGADPRTHRSHIRGAGTLETQYFASSRSGKTYRQYLYSDFGTRSIAAFNHNGISGLYDDQYYKVQLLGEIPLTDKAYDKGLHLHYMANGSRRNAMGQEFYFNPNEVMCNNAYAASVYLKQEQGYSPTQWTVGLTYMVNTAQHDSIAFSRNLADQDGEAFEPWIPDGITHEVNLSTTLKHKLLPWLQLHYEGYNSLMHFAPTTSAWSNSVYLQLPKEEKTVPYYTYAWQSNAFTSGILENTLGLQVEYAPASWVTLHGLLDVTLDGVLLDNGKSIVRPNWQAYFGVDFHPAKWFHAEVNIANYRVAFNAETVRYFSDDYLNGNVYLADGTHMATTGGKYHHLADKVWQPSYLLFEIPLRFTLGRHEITLLPSYRKYYNQWTTRYAVAAEEYGRFEQKLFDDVQTPVYYLIGGGGGQQYIVDYQNTTDMGSSFLSNTPYVASATVKYTYNGKRVLVSASWQSYQVVGTSALGNGPMHNDIGVLSETTANPNTLLVTQNPEGKYPAVGRLDQDRAYIGRVLLGWNITDNWQFGFTFKFKDGQAFTNYDVCISDDGKQAVLINHRSRGINPTDGNFGSRDDAFFNLDMHIGYRGWIRKAVWLQAQLQAYNLYDFATELTEFCFEQEIVGSGRNAMSLCIPRGLILNMKVGF